MPSSKTFLQLQQFIQVFSWMFILFGIKEQASAGAPRMEDCEKQSCGNGINISYPFWIGGRQPSYCGYPSFMITCGNNSYTPVIQVIEHEFYILDIFYHNTSLVVTATEYFGDCPFPYGNITSKPIMYPLGMSSFNREVFFLSNCSSAHLDRYVEIPCAESNGRSAYYGGDYGGVPERAGLDEAGCEIYVAPVMGGDPDNFTALLRRGWMLNWTDIQCPDCVESGGWCGFNETLREFICICSDQSIQPGSCSSAVKKKGKRTMLVLGFVISLAASSLCLFLFIFIRGLPECLKYPTKWKTNANNWQSAESFIQGSLVPKRYEFAEIKRMTESFRYKLGQGGFGSVFKATLPDGRLVAVKLLREAEGDGEEFINEVASISKTSHVNVVTLLGFCSDKSKRALIYDYMPNGSLEKYIYSSDESRTETQFCCEKLYEITLGIARGLEYLHGGCNTRIVHFDIKPHNILLDQDFCPKISDFGLAKFCRPKESIISIAAARGTVGFIAPEVFSRSFGVVSTKSDVYSYGMMLLEMVGGRRNIDAENGKSRSSEVYFPHWLYDNFDRHCREGIPGITSETEETMKKMIVIGLWCIQMMPENRPSMRNVVEMLKGNAEDLQLPPKP